MENLKKSTNLDWFMKVAKTYNLILNHLKCSYKLYSITLLGYSMYNREICPDPDHVEPPIKLLLPQSRVMDNAGTFFERYPSGIKFISLCMQINFLCLKLLYRCLKHWRNIDLMAQVIEPTSSFPVETNAFKYSIAAVLRTDTLLYSCTLGVGE